MLAQDHSATNSFCQHSSTSTLVIASKPMSRLCLRSVFSGVVVALCNFDAAIATEQPPIRASVAAPYDWNGLYFGGHVGYGRGRADTTVSNPAPAGASNSFGGLFGGVQAGYNHLWSSRVLLGIEADVSFPNYLSADDVVAARTTTATDVAHKIDYMATLRGRFGYVF